MKPLQTIWCFLFIGWLSTPLAGQKRAPVIDMHLHIGAPMDLPAGAPAPCRPFPCERKGKATASSADNLQKTLEAMNRYNIVKAFLSDVDHNDLQQWKEAAPDRFILSPFVVEPEKTDLDDLRKKFEAKQWGGIGEIGA